MATRVWTGKTSALYQLSVRKGNRDTRVSKVSYFTEIGLRYTHGTGTVSAKVDDLRQNVFGFKYSSKINR